FNGLSSGGDTTDYVFILSYEELTNEDYGFCSIGKNWSNSRNVSSTDYAKIRGTHGDDSVNQWIRTTGDEYYSLMILEGGSINYSGEVGTASIMESGVAPALYLDLDSDEWTLDYEENDNGFDLKEDGYSFENDWDSFGYSDGDKISIERYKEVFGNSYTKLIYDQYADVWGGSCFGMSASADMFYKKMLNKEFYLGSGRMINSVGSYVFAKTRAVKPDDEIQRIIERYQIWQDSDGRSKMVQAARKKFEMRGDKQKNKKIIGEIINSIKNENKTYLVSVHWPYIDKNGVIINVGHAMLIDSKRKPKDLGNGWLRLYLYDPNKPYYDDYEKDINETALGRFVDVNPTTGEWRLDAMSNADSKNTGKTGFADDGAYLDDTWMYFMSTDEIPADFKTKAKLSPNYGGKLMLAYSCNDFSVYANDSEKTLLYSKENGVVTHCDESVFDSVYIDDTTDVAGSKGRGQLLLAEGDYTVDFKDGMIAFLSNGDYAGVSAEGDTTVSNPTEKSLKINAEEPESINVVIEDVDIEASDESGNNDVFTCIGTDIKVDDSDCQISLDGSKLVVDTEDAQKINVKVETDQKEKDLSDVVTGELKSGLDVVSDETVSNNNGPKPAPNPTPEPKPTPNPTPNPTPAPVPNPTSKAEEKVKAPKKATLKSAKRTSTTSIKLTLKKLSADGYQVQVATDKKFKNNKKSKSITKTSYTFKKLKKDKTYFVRVRAYNRDKNGKKVYGKWSKVKQVKVKK
ncbi:MAG: fibronectin type III domain-containing protein, partial [Lachnospiraceae bacterium]|nr:fibronectin type III domain-containing protein [Lachnospiraceae bacterium]